MKRQDSFAYFPQSGQSQISQYLLSVSMVGNDLNFSCKLEDLINPKCSPLVTAIQPLTIPWPNNPADASAIAWCHMTYITQWLPDEPQSLTPTVQVITQQQRASHPLALLISLPSLPKSFHKSMCLMDCSKCMQIYPIHELKYDHTQPENWFAEPLKCINAWPIQWAKISES